MAAKAQAEGPPPALPPVPDPSPERRAPSDAAGEEGRRLPVPEPKRRRASVAALDGVPGAAAAAAEEAADGPDSGCGGDGASFSFQVQRAQVAGFVAAALETTPKVGSFNPPAAAEQAVRDLEPALLDEEGLPTPSPCRDEEVAGEDDSSQLVDGDGHGQAQP